MSFLAPAFLLGLLALALPVLLHLLRRRVTRTVPFPALRFLAPTRADQTRQKIRRRIVLALRCLALAALAVAFARPFFGAPPSVAGQATVVVVDNSFSLQTGKRWPELRKWARDQLGQPARGDTVGLLLMNPRPTWLVPPTTDTAAALATLASLAPGWESTRAEPALRLAGDILAAAPARKRRIIFLGDQQASGWAGADFAHALPAGVAVLFPDPAPAPARQAALVATSLVHEGGAWSVSVTARNFTAAHKRTVSVFAEAATAPLAAAPFDLPAGDNTTVQVPLPAPAAGGPAPAWFRIALDADDLPADDTAWLVAPAARPADLPLLLDRSSQAVNGADFVATAFASLADLPPSFHILPPPSRAWPAPGLAVLRHDASFAGESANRLDAFLNAGGAALIFLGDGPARLRWLARHGVKPAALTTPSGQVRDWTVDHPLVTPLATRGLRNLVGWEFARAWALPAEACEPIAFWTDGTPALGEFPVGAGRVLLAGWSADRAAGDWPVSPAFVPFLHCAANHLLNLAATASAGAPRVGAALALPATPGTWRALSGPTAVDNSNLRSQISNSITPATPGLYEFAASGSPRRLFAVGLAPEESDPGLPSNEHPWQRLVSAEESPVEVEATRARSFAPPATEPKNPLWWWAFAGLALFALAELGLANRTAR